MDKQGIIDYVMETPTNTNPRILGQIIDEVSNKGNNNKTLIMFEIDTNQQLSCDYTVTEFINTFNDFTKIEPILKIYNSDFPFPSIYNCGYITLYGSQGGPILEIGFGSGGRSCYIEGDIYNNFWNFRN